MKLVQLPAMTRIRPARVWVLAILSLVLLVLLSPPALADHVSCGASADTPRKTTLDPTTTPVIKFNGEVHCGEPSYLQLTVCLEKKALITFVEVECVQGHHPNETSLTFDPEPAFGCAASGEYRTHVVAGAWVLGHEDPFTWRLFSPGVDITCPPPWE